MLLKKQMEDINKKITMTDFRKLRVKDYEYVYPGMKQKEFEKQLHIINPNGTMVFNSKRNDAISFMVAFSGLMDMTKEELLKNKHDLEEKYKSIKTFEEIFISEYKNDVAAITENQIRFLIDAELARRAIEQRYYSA